ncbi:hypothetical protein [Humibacter sp.]|uniref:hypothetical protein n=1 Tax=Humibacter sp. TaxID=1940291 RepID=UPI003F820CBD
MSVQSVGNLVLLQSARSEFATSLVRWAATESKLQQMLLPTALVDVWIRGLHAAGVNANHAKEWGRSKWPSELPFVIEFPCPYGHRSTDKRRLATVRLLIEDNGWPVLDKESECGWCGADVLEEWLMLCPRCVAGDQSPEHLSAGHLDMEGDTEWDELGIEPEDDDYRSLWLQSTGDSVLGSTAPLAFVLTEMNRRAMVAEATWWVAHSEEAKAEYVATHGSDKEWLARDHVLWGQRVLAIESATRKKPSAASRPATETSREKKPEWTPASAVGWMKDQGIQPGLTVVEAWNLAKQVEPHPPKRAVEAGLSHWKSNP